MVDRTLARLRDHGDLPVLVALLTDAKALHERNLLGLLENRACRNADDFAGFAYLQGTIHGIAQVLTLLQSAPPRS